MGFNHAGEEVWYDSDDEPAHYTVCPNSPGFP